MEYYAISYMDDYLGGSDGNSFGILGGNLFTDREKAYSYMLEVAIDGLVTGIPEEEGIGAVGPYNDWKNQEEISNEFMESFIEKYELDIEYDKIEVTVGKDDDTLIQYFRIETLELKE